MGSNFLSVRSDSEGEYSDVVVCQPAPQVSQQRKKTSNSSTAGGSGSSGSKRKADILVGGESGRSSKKPKKDLFSILSTEESQVIATDAPRLETSTFITRVAQGHTRRSLTLGGDFFIDCKVYKSEDIRNEPGDKRFKKALASIKLQCNEGSKEWNALQDFINASHKLFEQCESIFFNYK
ncbi:hypothetical protein NE865_06523 [Phthorimaea operculella]|nr:hypothetical protein NE865_06523 [Phthorimaea operculella]